MKEAAEAAKEVTRQKWHGVIDTATGADGALLTSVPPPDKWQAAEYLSHHTARQQPPAAPEQQPGGGVYGSPALTDARAANAAARLGAPPAAAPPGEMSGTGQFWLKPGPGGALAYTQMKVQPRDPN